MTQIVYMFMKEMILSLVGKVMWKAVAERASTRLLIFSLRKLESYSTNSVVRETVADVINSLRGKGLKVIEEESNESLLDTPTK
jgi:hypothetical protein